MSNRPDIDSEDRPLSASWGRFALLLFGILTLGYLTMIDHQEWFHIKPATGTAAAMSYASDIPRAADEN